MALVRAMENKSGADVEALLGPTEALALKALVSGTHGSLLKMLGTDDECPAADDAQVSDLASKRTW